MNLFLRLIFLFVLTVNSVKAKFQTVAYWESWDTNRLNHYCKSNESDMADIYIVSFLSNFPGSFSVDDFNSQYLPQDIKECQKAGKKILLSLGGADGNYNGFKSTSEANDFAAVIFNAFFTGNGPLGNGVLFDGVDLDIEKGSSAGYGEFLIQLRTLAQQHGRPILMSAAPQCPYPDEWAGPATGKFLSMAQLDFVNVQFYNNYCSPDNKNDFNYKSWATWAKQSLNPKAKIYIGLIATGSGSDTGYIDLSAIKSLVKANYKDEAFGGVMMWAAHEAEANNNILSAVGNYLDTLTLANATSDDVDDPDVDVDVDDQ